MTHPIAFWCRLWQKQIEAAMTVTAAWGSMLPHDSATALSAEAEALRTAPPAPRAAKPRRKAA